MLSCYSFSTFTHVTCSLSVFTIFSLRWEVHLYSNIFTHYTLYILPISNFWTFTFFGFFSFRLVWLLSFRSSLLTKSRLIYFPFATKIFQFAKLFLFLVSLLEILVSVLLILDFSWFFTSFLVNTLVILQIPIYTFPFFLHIKRLELLKPTWKAGGLPVNLCVLILNS